MPYKSIIKNTVPYLKSKMTILYPTDTVWGIGCDATNEDAVNKIYKLKNRSESKSLIILVDGLDMLRKIIPNIPIKALEIITDSKRPTSIIYKNPRGLAHNVVSDDNTVGIRIVQDPFCRELIHDFGKPIVSTSANISGETTPKTFDEISYEIKENVNYIVPITSTFSDKPSRIIKIVDNTLTIIRE